MNDVRVATAEEVPALVRLINTVYRLEDFFLHGERTSETEIRDRMRRPGVTFLVVAAGPSLVATVCLEIDAARGFFSMLAVDPARQKQGLARVLIAAMEDRCRAAGCSSLDLDIVNLREELPAFYDRFGFTPQGMAPFHTPERLKRPAHLVLMTKALMVALLVLATGCGNAPASSPAPPAKAPEAPAGETPAAPDVRWDPWSDATARGVEFRAVGNEPGWYLELDNDRWMRILYDYGERVATVPPPKPAPVAGASTFESSASGHTISVDIADGPCNDGMSDQSYPLNVTVRVDGVTLRGCGRWLR